MIKVIRYILLFLLLSTPAMSAEITCSAAGGFSDMNNSATGTNHTILGTCMTAAQGEVEKIVNIPSSGAGRFEFSEEINVPAGISLVGESGAKIGGEEIRLNNYSKLINLDINGYGRSVVVGEPGTYPNTGYITGIHIRGCTFDDAYSWAMVILYRVNESIIDNNYFSNTYITGKGQNIQVLGGKRNIFTNNTSEDGKTGIIFKYSRLNNGGGFESMFDDNIVMNNIINNVGEEGISFDMVSTDKYGWPYTSQQTGALDYDTVAGVSGTEITLTHANWTGTSDKHIGYYMVPITGDMIGQYKKITDSANKIFTIDEAFTDLDVGDTVSIMVVNKGNVIAFNTIDINYDKSGILLYGGAFHNRVEYNTIRLGAAVRSLDEMRVADISVTGNGGRSPCGFNLFRKNTSTDEHYFGFIHRNLEQTNPEWTAYQSYGNHMVDNDNGVAGDIRYHYQSGVYCESGCGNTGVVTATDTDYAAAVLDITDQTCVEYGGTCEAGATIAVVDDLESTCGVGEVCTFYPDEATQDISVTVTATDATATETDTTTGEWTIACSPNCASTVVNYSFSGTATYTDDYTCDDSDGTITITGASDTITLTAVDDESFDPGEVAILTINAGTGYVPGSPPSGSISITDNESPPTTVSGMTTIDPAGSGSVTHTPTGSGSWTR